MLKDFTPRLYQQTILATAVSFNTLVVLPTGMGKTAIALMLAIARLRVYPESKVIFLAPTRPLVQQHKATFMQLTSFPEGDYAVFTGNVPPETRRVLFGKARIIFSTPQGLENDIINKVITLADVSLIIFDEAHRAVGEYSYGFIAKQYTKHARYPRILALTASPGSDAQTIQGVVKNLSIEKIEVRTDDDLDVKEYVQDVAVTQVRVALSPHFLQLRNFLLDCYRSKLSLLKDFVQKEAALLTKTELLALQRELQARLASGEKDFDVLRALSVVAEAMKAGHALELCETQGISPLVEYMKRMDEQAKTSRVRAVQNLVKDVNFRSARIFAEELLAKGESHPKLLALVKLVKGELEAPGTKIIIFSQYRDQGETIRTALDKEGIHARVFVGQENRGGPGMSQKAQKKVLDEFRAGGFSCLIATSVAEEGLDIPKVDVVVFYEPVPSAIRTVQRRGRTGRLEKGKVYVLVTKDTRDEAYGWSARHKEERMYRLLRSMKANPLRPDNDTALNGPTVKEEGIPPDQSRLDEFAKLKVVIDYREKGSIVMKALLDEGCEVQLKRLDVGDALVSERVCVEFKKVPDFVDSIIDGRLLSQLRDLRQYERPLVILEGEEDLYAMRKVHPNAIRGMLSTIAVQYGIPVIRTKNAKDTAGLVLAIAKQEQQGDKAFQYHSAKPFSLKDQQEYVVSALPGIGNTLAKPLLSHFRSVAAVVNASEQDLQKIDLIGPIKAKRMREVLDRPYEE